MNYGSMVGDKYGIIFLIILYFVKELMKEVNNYIIFLCVFLFKVFILNVISC